MLHIKNLDDGMDVFKALGSELRIRIIKLLLEHKEMNMNELAAALGVTNGALTSHIKQLSDAGLVTVLTERSGHGNRKLCRIGVDKLLVDIQTGESENEQNVFKTEIPIGHYSDYSVLWTIRVISPTPIGYGRGSSGLRRGMLNTLSPICCPTGRKWSRLRFLWS